ncbi:hypothetical protein BH09PLA1_BH09PLA1_35190 [soil metagenome]
MNGEDPARKDLPFGSEPIDRSTATPRADSLEIRDDEIPFDDIPLDSPEEEPANRWDADDERRRKDGFAPPKDPVECYCLHCQRTFMSDQIWFQRIIGRADSEMDGFWMCPTHNCSGAGFTFDIFPTDPDHPANSVWIEEDEDDYEPEDDEDLEEFNPDDVGRIDEVVDYDPEESKYKALDDEMGDGENDFTEGDEWKLGLQPGEPAPPQMYWSENSRKEWEAEQADYDAPDRRPRELDWSDRTYEDGMREDDIPF